MDEAIRLGHEHPLSFPDDMKEGSAFDTFMETIPSGGPAESGSSLLWVVPQIMAFLDRMNLIRQEQLEELDFVSLREQISNVSITQRFLQRHARRGGRSLREAIVRAANRAYGVRMALQYTVVGWSDGANDWPVHPEMLPVEPRPSRGGARPSLPPTGPHGVLADGMVQIRDYKLPGKGGG